MPYENELADKTSHVDIIKNPDVSEFLSKCHKIEYDTQEIETLGNLFTKPNDCNFPRPKNIISIDGSVYESSITEKFPSKKIGYIKIGVVLLKYDSLTQIQGTSNFVDPFEVASFKENNDAYSFVLPSTNIVYDNCDYVQESFRKALDEQFDKKRDNENDPKSSLRETLFKMASYLDGCNDTRIKLSKCPHCEQTENIVINKDDPAPKCPHCGKRLYITDVLRVWEQVKDETSNKSALNRTMSVIERLLSIHYIRTIVESLRDSYVNHLENICFFIDGPLALFGEPAKLHACFMKYLDELNQEMRKFNKSDILMIGIQKSGLINDFINLIKEHIGIGEIYCLTDDFINKYVNFEKNPASDTFGKETYYGQHFVYKNKKGSVFVFTVPYPYAEKSKVSNFKNEKSNILNYKNIKIYTDLLDEFDCSLYPDSLIPTVLAHKYTAISLAPGSKVLDLLSRSKVL
ncbi:DNA double-strand break repair nuclease NurA [Treponema sp.]|uniref:DNA double-strand break repair nuclease NurA n=1 Tax=Treponema sp. TaxID=166 RepID=UPI00298E2A2B|nr:DNA double-strand break repair nuclease NurA [Treponema sp.]